MSDLDLGAAIRCARFLSAAILQTGKPLPGWLTIHLDGLEAAARGSARGTDHVVRQAESDSIGTVEAARILGTTPRYVRRIAATLDGRRIGDRWRFDRRKVQTYAVDRNPGARAAS